MNNKKESALSMKFSGKHWWTLIYTTLLYFATAIITGTVQISAPGFAGLRGWNYASIMSLNTIGGLISIPVTFLFAQVIRKKGVKWPTLVFGILYGVAFMLYGSPSWVIFIIAALLANTVSNSLNMVSPNTLLTDWFPKKKGVVLGIATAGMMLAAIIAAPVVQLIVNATSLPVAFRIVGGFVIIIALLTLFIKNTPADAGTYPDNDPSTDMEEVARIKEAMTGKFGWSIGKLLANKDFWMLSIGFGLGFFALVGSAACFMPQGFEYGFTQPQMLLYMTLSGIGSVIGSYVLGAIDQAKSTKLAVIIYAIGMIIGSAARALGAGSPAIFMIGVFALPFFQGALANLMISYTIQVFGAPSYASVNRVMSPIVIAIRTMSFLVVGNAYQALGSYKYVSWIITGLLVISLICLLCVNSTTKPFPGVLPGMPDAPKEKEE